MKKLIPVILLVLGLIVVIAVVIIKAGAGSRGSGEEANLRELTLAEKPFTSLTPKDDGHWLKMVINEVKVDGAKTLDYELLYELSDGKVQGVPGTIPLSGAKIERDLLLGSESSGKFRYDDDVEKGTLSLRFRDDKGKLIAKLSTQFHLQKDPMEVSTIDGKFKYKLDEKADKTFFVVMDTFGLPKTLDKVSAGPYGVFASSTDKFPGSHNLSGKVSIYDGSDFKTLDSEKSETIGVFVATSE